MAFPARSLTAYARTWLAMSRHVRVLHVFEAACNLINENGEVVSPVSPQIGNGPFNLVVPEVTFSDVVTPDDPVICIPESLVIGSLRISTRSARLWNPRPDWELLHEKSVQLADCAPLLLDVLRDQAPAGSLAGLLINPTGPGDGTAKYDIKDDSRLRRSPPVSGDQRSSDPGRPHPPPLQGGQKAEDWGVSYSTAVLRAAREPANQIITGLRRDDRSMCLEGATKLAGLGGGLTPAGDDWLVGCLLGMWAITPARQTIPPAAIAQTAAPRTTPLSAAWLHAAARGECGAPWHTLINALVDGGESAIIQAAEIVIRQGNTSGADALAGFVAVLCSR